MATINAESSDSSREEGEHEDEEDIFILSTDAPQHEGEGADILRGVKERDGSERWRGRGLLERIEAQDEEREGEGEGDYFVDKELCDLHTKRNVLLPSVELSDEWIETESDELPSPLGLPGTTPPAGSRSIKQARKSHKYKGVKKLSLGHVPKYQHRDVIKKRPRSMISLESHAKDKLKGGRGRRNTAPSVSVKKIRREGGRGAAGVRKHQAESGDVGDGSSHVGSDEKLIQKKKKKRSQLKMSHERDEKAAQNPSSPLHSSLQPPQLPPANPPRRPRPPLMPVQSVDLPDYTPNVHHFHRDASPPDPLTSSLNFIRPPNRSSSAGLNNEETSLNFLGLPIGGRVYRSYSDAHVSLPIVAFSGGRHRQLDERGSVVCPPDRKQFFRRFQKALKYAAGISRPQPHPPETPFHPHMSRFHSENLSLDNPQGS